MAANADDLDLAARNRGELSSTDVNWRAKAAQDNPQAQVALGVMYHLGNGVVRDHAEAFKWYSRAAAKGYAPAQFNLGVMCEKGEGTLADFTEAIKWYRLAAKQGHARAQFKLGTKYAEGLAILHSKVKAHMWLNHSAANGEEAAANSRAELEKLMTTRQIIEAQKLAKDCLANGFKGCD
jgi:TPR repeat protein